MNEAMMQTARVMLMEIHVGIAFEKRGYSENRKFDYRDEIEELVDSGNYKDFDDPKTQEKFIKDFFKKIGE